MLPSHKAESCTVAFFYGCVRQSINAFSYAATKLFSRTHYPPETPLTYLAQHGVVDTYSRAPYETTPPYDPCYIPIERKTCPPKAKLCDGYQGERCVNSPDAGADISWLTSSRCCVSIYTQGFDRFLMDQFLLQVCARSHQSGTSAENKHGGKDSPCKRKRTETAPNKPGRCTAASEKCSHEKKSGTKQGQHHRGPRLFRRDDSSEMQRETRRLVSRWVTILCVTEGGSSTRHL